ncbi:MAG: hypothetical protein K1W23_19185 [Lachnospiraceae bacterium]|jgi:hypothetical protein
MKNQSLQDKPREKEPNVATAVLYHVQKSSRQGYIFVAVTYVALFVIMARLLMYQMDINQQNRR